MVDRIVIYMGASFPFFSALLLVLGMDIAGMLPKLKIPNLIDFFVLYLLICP